jgi:alpha/beta superfamily hydrolase
MRELWITSGELELEGRLHEAPATDRAWVVLHPHPQYGGDMDNHVVVALCEALTRAGSPALRFNFRGTGRSEGAYSGGSGEREDALAAIDEVLNAGAKTVGLAGYSFGAAIAASVAVEAGVERLVLVSPPTMGGGLSLPSTISTLVVTGEHDLVSSAAVVRAVDLPNVKVAVLPGVDHGWWPGVDELSELVVDFAT